MHLAIYKMQYNYVDSTPTTNDKRILLNLIVPLLQYIFPKIENIFNYKEDNLYLDISILQVKGVLDSIKTKIWGNKHLLLTEKGIFNDNEMQLLIDCIVLL